MLISGIKKFPNKPKFLSSTPLLKTFQNNFFKLPTRLRISKSFFPSQACFSFRIFFNFSSKKTKNSIFKTIFLWLPIIIRGKALEKLLSSPGKVIPSKKKQGQFLKVTLENYEKMHFFSFFGDVPKMALAIYMRGEKKS